MTCRQLGGACEVEFKADTFDEVAALSKQHGTDMFHEKEPAHLEAMQQMTEMWNNPQVMQEWMDGKRKEFEALPEQP